MTGSRRRNAAQVRLWADQRGAVSVEYLLVVGFIGLSTAIAILTVIPRGKARYATETTTLSQPYP